MCDHDVKNKKKKKAWEYGETYKSTMRTGLRLILRREEGARGQIRYKKRIIGESIFSGIFCVKERERESYEVQ